MEKVRPQILVVMLILGGLGGMSLLEGKTEITTGCVTLMGALGMKVLEKDYEVVQSTDNFWGFQYVAGSP